MPIGDLQAKETQYIEERLVPQRKFYSRKARRYKKGYHLCSVAVIVLSALIPVMVVIPGYDSLPMKLIVACLGASVSVLTGVLGLCKFQELWIKTRDTSEALKREKALYEACVEPYADEETCFPLLVARCEDIMGSEHREWRELWKKQS